MAKKGLLILVLIAVLCASASAIEKKEQALSALSDAEETLQEMQQAGFRVVLVEDTLLEAKSAFYGENYSSLIKDTEKIEDEKKREQARKLLLAAQKVATEAGVDYDLVLEKTAQIEEIKERAYDVNDLVQTLERRMQSIKETEPTIELGEAEGILAKAKEEFGNEFYDEAEKLASKGLDIVRTKQAEATQLKVLYKAGRENITGYLQDKWKEIVATVAVVAVLAFSVFQLFSFIFLKRELTTLRLEREVLTTLIKQLQNERFGKGAITQKEYEVKLKRFKDRLIDVEKSIPITKAKLSRKLFWKK